MTKLLQQRQVLHIVQYKICLKLRINTHFPHINNVAHMQILLMMGQYYHIIISILYLIYSDRSIVVCFIIRARIGERIPIA